MNRKTLGTLVTALASIAIAGLTLSPQEEVFGLPPAGFQATDVLLNIALFLPLGIGLALQGKPARYAGVVGGLASVAIEFAQTVIIPGRDSSIHDIFSNLTGVTAGALLVHHWANRRAWWPLIGGPIAALVLLYLSLGSRLVIPAEPIETDWYSQWQHDFPGIAPYQGKVLSFTVQGIELPDGTIENGGRLRERIRSSDTTDVRLRLESGLPLRRRSQIAGVVMGWPGPHYINILQRGTDLTVRPRLLMSALGFRSPVLVLRHAMPETAGDTLEIQAQFTRKVLRLSLAGKTHRETELRLAPDLALVALSPADVLTNFNTAPWWIRGLASLGGLFLLGLSIPSRIRAQGAGVLGWLLTGPVFFGTAFLPLASVGFGLAGLLLGNLLGRALDLV